MKITFKSIFAVVKNLFNGAVKFIFNDSAFTSEIATKQWAIYRQLKSVHTKAGTWIGSMRKEIQSKALKIAKQILRFEQMGMVQYYKVGDDITIHTVNILVGYLDFYPIGNASYRYHSEFVAEENGGDLSKALRSFKLDRTHFSI